MQINLLPPSYKQELREDKLRKKILKLLLCCLMSFVIASALLQVIYVNALKRSQQLTAIITTQQTTLKNSAYQQMKQQIEAANKSIKMIYQIRKAQISPVDVLENLIALIPPSIYLDSFSFQNIENQMKSQNTTTTAPITAAVQISGIAPTRETLFFFHQTLSQNTKIENVFFNPLSWVKAENPFFTAEFKVIKKTP